MLENIGAAFHTDHHHNLSFSLANFWSCFLGDKLCRMAAHLKPSLYLGSAFSWNGSVWHVSEHFLMKPLSERIHNKFHIGGFWEQSPQIACVPGVKAKRNFSGLARAQAFHENYPWKIFPKDTARGSGKSEIWKEKHKSFASGRGFSDSSDGVFQMLLLGHKWAYLADRTPHQDYSQPPAVKGWTLIHNETQ